MAHKIRENRTIVLPIEEKKYKRFLKDNDFAHKELKRLHTEYPELFPLNFEKNYMLNGRTRPSKKLDFKMRKVQVDGISYRIRPSFILSYNRAKTDDVSGALFLIKFGVPFWALAYLFGKNAMWWYRLFISLSYCNIVGTTIRDKTLIPKDIIADEHHIRILGNKAYAATTIGANCILGIDVSAKADEENLEKSYGVFKSEAEQIDPLYVPKSVGTDGWFATQKAWKSLYEKIQIIECFLHAFLKVRDRATKKLNEYFDIAGDKIWECYRAETKQSLGQQIRRLREWVNDKVPNCPMKDNILKLCKKKNKWMKHFDNPDAYRTSNMLDRLMRSMKKHAYNSQMFHGTIESTTKNFRAFALLYNFSPSCPAARINELESPSARLNGFIYHENWLHNFLISASLGGNYNHRNPL